jgi:N-ethylmaleimide reductase
MNALYYEQRASAGLIVSEATQISARGIGYPGTPGIHSAEQVAGWRLVTEAVHARGGRIVLQLWFCGRVAHPDLLPNHESPIAPSAIPVGNGMAATFEGPKPYVIPRHWPPKRSQA